MLRISGALVIILLCCNCGTKAPKIDSSLTSALNDTFYSASILHGHQEVLKYYFRKHYLDSCPPQMYDKKDVIEGFEGVAYIGDINHNNIADSVFVLNVLQFPCKPENGEIEDGMAYYFTDTTLPRLLTDTYCCHPTYLFSVGDIDEDGIAEIGEYRTSCVSRFKSLNIYSLKNNEWTAIGHATYDLSYADSTKPYSYYVKKIRKNQFEMLEITDLPENPKYARKPHWIKFIM